MKTITRNKRAYLSDDLIVNTWQDIESYFDELLARNINNKEELIKWIADRSETDAVIDEEYRWRYIRQTCDTEDEVHAKIYEDFITHIMPKWMTISNELNKKLAACPSHNELDQERFFVYLRSLKSQLKLFREENIPLSQQEQLLSQEYGTIIGAMTIEHDGNEYTLPQASVFLQNQDRNLRKTIYEKVSNRRFQDREKLNNLFSELLKIRHQIALNAGFENYRDYMFAEKGRFDYDVKACEQFHDAIKTEVIPLVKKIHQKRKQQLGVDSLFPYDLDVDAENLPALKPFETQEELIDKSIKCLHTVDSFFADCIDTMNNMNYLDLNSRKGKAPGGYNMTLPEIGVPFIFMNAAGTHRDLETMVHEAGHAVHSFLMRSLPYNFDQEISSEVAELASMSMELMTFDGLDAFYNEADKKRAIESHLEGIITMLPWIALVDKFQHWIYTEQDWSIEKTLQYWHELHKMYFPMINWEGYDTYRSHLWHRQLHIFEIPFYYIEYGIAQLGAIGLWKNYHMQPDKAIEDYMHALALGNTVTIPEMYRTAGVNFDFSAKHIKELMDFVLLHL